MAKHFKFKGKCYCGKEYHSNWSQESVNSSIIQCMEKIWNKTGFYRHNKEQIEAFKKDFSQEIEDKGIVFNEQNIY